MLKVVEAVVLVTNVVDEDEVVMAVPVDVALPIALLEELGMAKPHLKASSIASLSASPPLERIHAPQLGSRFEASAELQTHAK